MNIILNENMEMPTLCDCGNWFDLNDGYGAENSNTIICESCHRKEEAQKEFWYKCEDAFSEDEFRTLGLYQPFASLMLHGKIESRWVKKGKKPPFPLGKYLFYSTKKYTSQSDLFNWCGEEIMSDILDVLKDETTKSLNGYAIAVGDLVRIKTFNTEDTPKVFVKHEITKIVEGVEYERVLLVFEKVERIEPFEFRFGKQGVGFVNSDTLNKISLHIANNTQLNKRHGNRSVR